MMKKIQLAQKIDTKFFSDYKKFDLKGKKIGLPKEYIIDGLNEEIKKTSLIIV